MQREWKGGVTLTSLSSLSLEVTALGKRVDKVQVPVRYCMLGSRDSARSVTSSAPILASLVPSVGLVTEAGIWQGHTCWEASGGGGAG